MRLLKVFLQTLQSTSSSFDTFSATGIRGAIGAAAGLIFVVTTFLAKFSRAIGRISFWTGGGNISMSVSSSS